MNRHHKLFLRRNKKKIYGIIIFIIVLILFLSLQGSAQNNKEIISPCPKSGCTVITPTASPTPTITPTPKPMYKGKVSYYSHAGCLGCSENQTMGNGETFDEMASTIAIPCEDVISKKHRYNTMVLVINEDTGKSIEAKVADCGGFSKYNRVADVSKGIYTELAIKTDITNIRIEEL